MIGNHPITLLDLAIVACMIMAIPPANRARRKGRNWFLWWLVAMFTWPFMWPSIEAFLDKRWPPKPRNL
jgi:hypothetical protein